MAITLPAIWLSYDLIVRRPLRWTAAIGRVLLPALIGGIYAFSRVTTMGSSDRSHPYYMDITWITLGRGLGGYFKMLFGVNWRWQIWSIGFVVTIALLALLKQRLAIFFQLYVLITFLPLIFLINHREPAYWYFPMIGVCGLAAFVTNCACSVIAKWIPKRAIAALAALAFSLMSYQTYTFTRSSTEGRRVLLQDLARDYAGFVSGLETVATPKQGEILYFTSIPPMFTTDELSSATMVALRRPDLSAQLVNQCPDRAMYCLRFENSKLLSGR